MPFFGAIGLLRWLKFQKRKPLNRRSLMNGRLNSFQFSPITSTDARSPGQETQAVCAGIRSASVRHGWDPITTTTLHFVAYLDGGSFGNPDPSGIGVVISGSADGTIRIARWIGQQDNNVADYVALLEALQCALLLKAKALRVFSDSEVMVKQMSGEYSCRSPRLYSLNWICRKLARSLDFGDGGPQI